MTQDVSLQLCWGTTRGIDLIEFIRVAAATGFTSTTITPSMYFDALRDGFTNEDLRHYLDDAGVTIDIVEPLTQGLPSTPKTNEVDPSLRTLVQFSDEDCYQASKGVGARLINIADFMGKTAPMGPLIDAIGAMNERALTEGFQLTLEFIPMTGMHDLAAAKEIIAAIGSPNVRVMFDTWHFYRSGGTLADLVDLPPGIIGGVQISDATEDALGGPYVPMVSRKLPGDGILPLGEIVAALLDSTPDVEIGVEVFNAQFRRLPATQAASQAYERMTRVVDEALAHLAKGA